MSALPKLVIIGAGGFGREAWAWAEQSVQIGREWELKGFIDDNPDALKVRRSPGRVLSTIQDYQPAPEDVFVCAIGIPAIKRRVAELMESRGGRFTRLVHRSVVLGNEVQLGEGVILCPFVAVTANNVLGKGVGVNVHASIDHDAKVGDWSQINCHCDLTASVQVGEEVFLGSRVTIYPGVTVESRAHVGGGSVVMRDVPTGWKMVGSPARRIG